MAVEFKPDLAFASDCTSNSVSGLWSPKVHPFLTDMLVQLLILSACVRVMAAFLCLFVATLAAAELVDTLKQGAIRLLAAILTNETC